MASINMSIRTDSELKAQAEQVLSQLGMNMTGDHQYIFAADCPGQGSPALPVPQL